MAGENTVPGWGDLFALFGSNNPLAVMTKSAEQFRTAVTGFIEAVSTFKQTMDSLNAVTTRMNRLLDEIEGPIHILMPQMTAATEQASKVFTMLSGPVERVAPGLAQLADTLNNPALMELPRRMTEAMDAMVGLPKTLGPLGQMAEMAGGLFGGGMRGLSAFSGARSQAATKARPLETVAAPSAAPMKAVPERPPAKKTAAKKAAAPKNAAPKKAGAEKAAAPKTTSREAGTRTARSARATFAKSAALHTAAPEPRRQDR